jgi:hypothetical protein
VLNVTAQANEPQGLFLALQTKHRAFVGGYGSGKTWVGCQAQCKHYWEFPKVKQGYFAPTYPIIRDVFYPTIEEVAFSMDLNVEIKEGNHEVHVYSGRAYRGTTICRSLDHPGSIVGFSIGHASVDEIDILTIQKAEDCWRKIIARMRKTSDVDGLKNGIDILTTPEGFRFCHKMFVQMVQENPELSKNYGMIQASTYDNEANLPEDYIPSLKEIYPAELIEAYINGQFVNLTSGTVFRNYDRVRCNSNEFIRDGEPLFIGQDFNVQKMASAIFVQRPDGYHAVAELKDVFDTPDVIKIIQEKYKGHRIIMYPDASGKSRKTVDASKTDLSLLTQAGFAVRVNSTNPAIKDRILATNKAFEAGKIKVNAKACPTIARCLEQQAYDDNGEPDKNSGFDHMNEAFSYFVAYEMPIIKPMSRMAVVGI